ncbi:hypothetical protein [Spirosoma rhododendri]|uniref:Uncharacterized protein n=1 Tax=Spirosoma rhododendri TaxID=2728024 RepID=A0A7L5DZX5_9BACT|nr:hypothetical protein [Spirosoma rhododendri]QJD81050.1 hypothetical protein HH216_23455 [Spirosoma rhododendri]
MNQTLAFNYSVVDLDEMTFDEMTLIEGGMTPYEAGRAVGALVQIAATIIAFL